LTYTGICQKEMPHFLCCVQVIRVKTSQNPLQFRWNSTFFKIYSSCLSTAFFRLTPLRTFLSFLYLLPMHSTLRSASSCASAPPARCHSGTQQVKNLWCAVRSVGCLRKSVKYRVLASELHRTVWIVFVMQEQRFWHFSWQIKSTTAGIRTSYSFNIRELSLVPVDKKNAHVFSYGNIMKSCCVTVQNKDKYQGLFTCSVNPLLFRDMAIWIRSSVISRL